MSDLVLSPLRCFSASTKLLHTTDLQHFAHHAALAHRPSPGCHPRGGQESLRLRPPVSGTMRTPARDLRLGPYTLPAGTLININLGVMGNSALNYESPDLYLPVGPAKSSWSWCP